MTADALAATLDEVRQHPTFRNHAAAFASAIGMAVESLDDWDGDLTATRHLHLVHSAWHPAGGGALNRVPG